MKKLLFVLVCFFIFQSGYSQKAPPTNTSPTNYYHEGVRTGCGLAKSESFDLLRKTINAKFPSQYIAGVLEGWSNCYKPKKQLGNLGKVKRNSNGTYTVKTH